MSSLQKQLLRGLNLYRCPIYTDLAVFKTNTLTQRTCKNALLKMFKISGYGTHQQRLQNQILLGIIKLPKAALNPL